MYKDEIWYRRFEQAVDTRRDSFTDEQWKKFGVDYLLRVANRVREFSDSCETCKSYQHTLQRLEEELQELPGSKAQRQYQTGQLDEIGQHFAAEHRLAPPRYFVRRWLRYGLISGLVLGFIGMLMVGYLILFPAATLALTAAGALYGHTQDQKCLRARRVV